MFGWLSPSSSETCQESEEARSGRCEEEANRLRCWMQALSLSLSLSLFPSFSTPFPPSVGLLAGVFFLEGPPRLQWRSQVLVGRAPCKIFWVVQTGASSPERSSLASQPPTHRHKHMYHTHTHTHTHTHGKRLKWQHRLPLLFKRCSQTQPRRVAGVDDAAILRLRKRRALPGKSPWPCRSCRIFHSMAFSVLLMDGRESCSPRGKSQTPEAYLNVVPLGVPQVVGQVSLAG